MSLSEHSMGASPGAADRVRHKLRAASFKKHGKDLHNLLSAFDINHDGKLPVAKISEGVQELLPGVVAPNELEILLGTASSELVDYRSFFEFTPVQDFVSPVSPVSLSPVSPAAQHVSRCADEGREEGGAPAPAAPPLSVPISSASMPHTPLAGGSSHKTTVTTLSGSALIAAAAAAAAAVAEVEAEAEVAPAKSTQSEAASKQDLVSGSVSGLGQRAAQIETTVTAPRAAAAAAAGAKSAHCTGGTTDVGAGKTASTVGGGDIRIMHLCEQDKRKVATLIQQLVQAGTEKEQMQKQMETDAAQATERLARLRQQNEELVAEVARGRAKLGKALSMLRVYQEKILAQETLALEAKAQNAQGQGRGQGQGQGQGQAEEQVQVHSHAEPTPVDVPCDDRSVTTTMTSLCAGAAPDSRSSDEKQQLEMKAKSDPQMHAKTETEADTSIETGKQMATNDESDLELDDEGDSIGKQSLDLKPQQSTSESQLSSAAVPGGLNPPSKTDAEIDAIVEERLNAKLQEHLQEQAQLAKQEASYSLAESERSRLRSELDRIYAGQQAHVLDQLHQQRSENAQLRAQILALEAVHSKAADEKHVEESEEPSVMDKAGPVKEGATAAMDQSAALEQVEQLKEAEQRALDEAARHRRQAAVEMTEKRALVKELSRLRSELCKPSSRDTGTKSRAPAASVDVNGQGLADVAMRKVCHALSGERRSFSLRPRDVFRSFDADNRGIVTRNQFRQALQALSVELSRNELAALFGAFAEAGAADRLNYRVFDRAVGKAAAASADADRNADTSIGSSKASDSHVVHNKENNTNISIAKELKPALQQPMGGTDNEVNGTNHQPHPLHIPSLFDLVHDLERQEKDTLHAPASVASAAQTTNAAKVGQTAHRTQQQPRRSGRKNSPAPLATHSVHSQQVYDPDDSWAWFDSD